MEMIPRLVSYQCIITLKSCYFFCFTLASNITALLHEFLCASRTPFRCLLAQEETNTKGYSRGGILFIQNVVALIEISVNLRNSNEDHNRS